jgi:hypothetical protein
VVSLGITHCGYCGVASCCVCIIDSDDLLFNKFKRFLPFESSGNVLHIEKSGHFTVDVVLKSPFMRVHYAILYQRLAQRQGIEQSTLFYFHAFLQ